MSPVKIPARMGLAGISPVDAFPTNGYGLRDMAGNVWQSCIDWYRPDYFKQFAESGNVACNPQGPEMSFDPAEPKEKKRVQKEGSYLCTDQYCTRYMVVRSQFISGNRDAMITEEVRKFPTRK